jgi:hypothetical protein
MDVLTALQAELAKLDAHWTAKLRSDGFDTDRTRHQAVGRVKQIDEIRQIVAELKHKKTATDDFEEIENAAD